MTSMSESSSAGGSARLRLAVKLDVDDPLVPDSRDSSESLRTSGLE